MKFILLPVLIIHLCSCSETVKPIDKFYVELFDNGTFHLVDTIAKLPSHDVNDRLISTFGFYYLNEGHQVRIYNNEHTAPIDGEHTIYELDGFGGILGQSHTWNSYNRAHSTNDSIEKLFSAAIDQCLTRIRVKPLENPYKSSETVTFSSQPIVN